MKPLNIKWLVSIWCIACLAGLLMMSVKQLSDFDPEAKLSIAISDIGFEKNLIKLLRSTHSSVAKSIIHFSNDSCFCEVLADTHIAKFSNNMRDEGFNNIQINLNQFPEYAHFVPSTPAVAVIGKDSEVIYLGPYAEGYGCLSGSGLVDTLIPKIISNSIENTLFVTDSKGCFCQT